MGRRGAGLAVTHPTSETGVTPFRTSRDTEGPPTPGDIAAVWAGWGGEAKS
jgi:hypothetical protein